MNKFQEYVQTLPFIEENKNWLNGTGYLDNAVTGREAPLLKPGELARSQSNGRTVLFVGEEEGNLVIFRRYTGDQGPWVCNVPLIFERECEHDLTSCISEEVVKDLLGYTQ